jgi:hypothetical protein
MDCQLWFWDATWSRQSNESCLNKVQNPSTFWTLEPMIISKCKYRCIRNRKPTQTELAQRVGCKLRNDTAKCLAQAFILVACFRVAWLLVAQGCSASVPGSGLFGLGSRLFWCCSRSPPHMGQKRPLVKPTSSSVFVTRSSNWVFLNRLLHDFQPHFLITWRRHS